MNKMLFALCASGAAFLASPAIAGGPPPPEAPTYIGGTNPCSTEYAGGAIACQGYYDKNLLQGAVGDLTPSEIQTILNTLLTGLPLNSSGDTPTDSTPVYVAGSYGSLDYSHILGAIDHQTDGDSSFDFGSLALSGLTLFGAHFGNNTDGGNATDITAFWLLDLGSDPTHIVNLADGMGVSNARIYATSISAIPEPATWAMMIVGFWGMGFAMRRANARKGVASRVLA